MSHFLSNLVIRYPVKFLSTHGEGPNLDALAAVISDTTTVMDAISLLSHRSILFLYGTINMCVSNAANLTLIRIRNVLQIIIDVVSIYVSEILRYVRLAMLKLYHL